VKTKDKIPDIKEMFAGVSTKYDKLNDILSFGIHRKWKRKTVELTEVKKGQNILDCACGTGDLAIEYKKATGNSGIVIASDFCEEMLALAEEKAKSNNTFLVFVPADVLKLPFGQDSFDIASIGFGIRNVEDNIKCLREMARVVNKKGKVVVLEFGNPGGIFKFLYSIYSLIIPIFARIITGDAQSYKYLTSSIREFSSGKNFIEIMEQSKVFASCRSYKLTFGIAYIYIGIVK
jgi:demethylmenaquinone methyltransferase/2-methoxy-6-polyprenyl-1,4-benzoquinol methylase